MVEVLTEWEALEIFGERLDATDDCAVLPTPDADNVVVTTDMLHSSTDLPEGVTPYTVGWRVAAVNFSDVASMGAEAEALVVAAGLPEFRRSYVDSLVDGVEDCCSEVDASYVGGDLDGHDEETYVGTALGYVDDPVERSGAEPGDRVCVTGELCRTAVALREFEDGDLERGNELFRFTPRVEEATALQRYASAMTDVSDGVAVSLHQLSLASDVSFDVHGDAFPLVEEAVFDDVYVGGDYELLFTLPEDEEPEVDVEYTVVGDVGTRNSDDADVRLDGEPMERRGYSHSN